MDTKNFSNLLIKIAGIVIVILSINNITSLVTYYQAHSLSLFLGTVIVPAALPLCFGIFMFKRPQSITNKIIFDENQDINKIQSDTCLKLEQIALTVVGFYFLFQSMADLVFHITNFIQTKAHMRDPISDWLILGPAFFATIAELVIALWLIFKAKGIVAFVNKIRAAGRP